MSKISAKILNGSTGITLDSKSFRSLPLSDAIFFPIKVWWPLDKQYYHGVAKVQNENCYVYYDDGDIRRYPVSDLASRKVQLTRTILNTPDESPVQRGFFIPEKCSLCLSSKIECPSRIMSCKHMFCGSCLQKSLWSSSLCPICRVSVDTCQLMSYNNVLKWKSIQQQLKISTKKEEDMVRLIAHERSIVSATISIQEREIDKQLSELEEQLQKLQKQRQEIQKQKVESLSKLDKKRLETIQAGQKARQKMRLDLLFRKLNLNF